MIIITELLILLSWYYERFDCHLPSCGGFTEYFSAARSRTTLAFLDLKIVVQNAPSDEELLDMTSIP